MKQRIEEAGKAAYDAYCATRDWKSFRGEPLPQWQDSPEDIRHGWREAAQAVANTLKLCETAVAGSTGGRFRKRPVVIDAITFDEFVAFGRENCVSMVNGVPWSFIYKDHPITHENDECYLVPTLEGTMRFTPADMLITGVKGEIYPCKREIFEATYEAI